MFTAHWTTRPQPLIPRKWEGRGWTMWQFAVNVVDRDRFNGNEEDFARWMGEDLPPSDIEQRVAELEENVQLIVDWIQHYGP